jgi:TRAP-type C4-dicarboxylate transport system substrate-binding protein
VITALDHTLTVCNITKKCEIAKHFTQIDYAQGLFVHLINKKWFDKLPADLQKILLDTIVEESAATRELTRKQHDEQVVKAKEKGVTFYRLSDADLKTLATQSEPVYQAWGEKIGADYLARVRKQLAQ